MEVFKCYYCPYKTNSFEEIIDHCSILHEDELLKYRTLILDDLTGILQYQTKTHEGVVPRKIKECGKSLCLSGSYRLIVKDDQISKKKKLNTPIKSAENKYIERSDETADELENLSTYDEIQFLLPKVIKNLEESGQLDSYIKYNELLASGRLPSNNICYLLFLDIVEWFSSENTSQMRYKFPETVKFWQIGNQLFHGKFIRFMSGLRHFGHVVEGSCDRGVFDPSTSRINFAVPSKTTLQSIATKASFYPGINDELLSSLSSHLANKPLNLSVDGKKICRGKGKHMGDINCWGFENKPTLSERQEKLEIDKALMESIITRLDILEGRGIDKINQISKSEKSIIHNELISVVKTLSIRNKQLRETESSLVLSEEKLKKLAGSDWRKSRYFPAIASVRVKRNDIKEHLDESMKLLTKVIRFGAEIADAKERFSSPKVNMDEQANYFCLNPQFESECSRFIRQRTPAWHVVRDQAKVTGSTVHGAIGLDTLKKQQQHFDQKVSGKPKPEFSDEVKERMKYGTVHEIDAIATLTGTVLPFMFPALSYFEEGCLNIRTEMDEQFMVVSPDGSLRTSQERAPAMMYENKCKSPNSYSRYAYYAIPSYYALQILSEMKAYDCDKLLFTCWSMTSMTVFIAHFDNALWDICWSELVKIYGCENPKRPTRFSDVAKQLRPLIREYVEKKVEFLGEFPSCQAQTDKVWDIAETNTDCPYIEPSSPERMIKSSVISDLQDCLVSAKKWINSAYYYSRTVATEILVYMLNDLDRFYQIETNIAHPIAYALKGTSLKGETFTAMLEHVI